MDNNLIAVARVGKLFGQTDKGGLSVTLYTTFPDDFDAESENLFVEIDSLIVPLFCDSFERRGKTGANICFADFDTQRRAEELIGKELLFDFGENEDEDDDEFYMEDLIGFEVTASKLRGKIVDYYDSEMNPLLGIDFGQGERLVPAAEEFILHIDFDNEKIKMLLPEGLMEL